MAEQEYQIKFLKKALELERERAGITAEKMAPFLGISGSMYSLWLRGKRELGRDALRKIQERYPDFVSKEMIEAAGTRGPRRQEGVSDVQTNEADNLPPGERYFAGLPPLA